ncbi:hypothetical protein AA103196_1215 [Ameyamaea chiangmaiensis NBRC 103196]|uniref:Uncharacterized protein n=1 Tax=Ameyamaea chiangmaiensis TaxID=442969 RepID=A0A850PCV7_9PROT|nr:hypothetical protein [Ameyamaea chiangmaiensis]MBS4075017.1 hypothetical protein [Ameyamaea chiangmaiensis]NVN41818.1 hypothetical protein [Ameyamaea chiangmaiensis]GBQ65766.1 hypothetical protein AA103196_1215 [Ameyamaea chiangmaiensis NBRC 103196]
MKKNIQYGEFNSTMKTISSAIDKLKIQKDDAEKKDKTKESGINQT